MLNKLKKARLERNLTLKDVSKILKIQVDYLSAIETENFSVLPESVYAIGFIRNYAKFLDIESDSIILNYKYTLAITQKNHTYIYKRKKSIFIKWKLYLRKTCKLLQKFLNL